MIRAQMTSVSELNKLKVRLFFEAVLNQGRLELIDELLAADFVGHIPCLEPGIIGRDEIRRLVSSHRRAHHDLCIKIEDQVAEEDRVVTRWRATAARRSYSGISIIRLLAGKQVDSHTESTEVTTSTDPLRSRAA